MQFVRKLGNSIAEALAPEPVTRLDELREHWGWIRYFYVSISRSGSSSVALSLRSGPAQQSPRTQKRTDEREADRVSELFSRIAAIGKLLVEEDVEARRTRRRGAGVPEGAVAAGGVVAECAEYCLSHKVLAELAQSGVHDRPEGVRVAVAAAVGHCVAGMEASSLLPHLVRPATALALALHSAAAQLPPQSEPERALLVLLGGL